MSHPWVLIGDFNEVLCQAEKLRGRPADVNWIIEFKTCLDHYYLLDFEAYLEQ